MWEVSEDNIKMNGANVGLGISRGRMTLEEGCRKRKNVRSIQHQTAKQGNKLF